MIKRDPIDTIAGSEPVSWAVGQLQETLDGVATAVPQILVAGPSSAQAGTLLAQASATLPEAPESLALARVGDTIVAAGRDVRGLVYAVLELTDRLRHAGSPAEALRLERRVVEQPANAIRSVARLFTSEVEDKAWWYDRAFWEAYLTELATHRFNRFALMLGLGYNFPRGVTDDYLHFTYPFLLDVPGYAVRATNLPDDERDRNLATLQFIGQEVKRRGLHFQLALWTYAYEWVDSPHATYPVQGLNAGNHAPYCRDALRLLLEKVPTVDGLTFRVHGESGIPEGSYDFWRTVFDGVVDASRQLGRPLEIDMHAKGVDQETIDVALATGLPVTISPKYWAEHQGLPYHQASIREIERTAPPKQGHMAISSGERRHSRYGYTDLLREDREYDILFRIWPGTQRLLLWGDPVLAAAYGRHASFGSASGVELCEPLTFKGRMGSGLPGGRNGYADESLTPEGGQSADWKKYRYTYRVWGRCTYSPETDPDGWRRYLHHEFGQDASHAEEALASASRILLLITTAYGPSANCKMYWPEVYTNMPLVSEVGHPYTDTFSPKRFVNASSLDPELFAGVDEFAEEVLTGNRSGRYSPLDVARWLDTFATTATNSLSRWPSTLPPSALQGEGQGEKTLPVQEQGKKGISPETRRWQADIAIQASLGQFFADKLRAGLAYAFYCRTGDQASLREALDSYRSARGAWAAAAAHGRVYRDDLTFGPEPWQRGHWADRLPAIDADIAAMEAHLAQGRRQVNGETTASSAGQRSSRDLLSFTRDGAPCPAEVLVEHTPPASFARGEPVSIEVAVAPVNASLVPAPIAVQLRYRHANQAEAYEMVEMQAETAPEAKQDGGGKPSRYRATIPGTYTDSLYPLVYFFRIRDASDRAWLHPGLDEALSNQPYYLLRQVPH